MLRLEIMKKTITDMRLFSIADEFRNNVLTKLIVVKKIQKVVQIGYGLLESLEVGCPF